jgi:hypothetical protein
MGSWAQSASKKASPSPSGLDPRSMSDEEDSGPVTRRQRLPTNAPARRVRQEFLQTRDSADAASETGRVRRTVGGGLDQGLFSSAEGMDTRATLYDHSTMGGQLVGSLHAPGPRTDADGYNVPDTQT